MERLRLNVGMNYARGTRELGGSRLMEYEEEVQMKRDIACATAYVADAMEGT